MKRYSTIKILKVEFEEYWYESGLLFSTNWYQSELLFSIEAYEHRKKKKEGTLDQAHQTKALIKDEKVLYYQNTQGRVRGNRRNGRGSQGNIYEENYKEKRLSSESNWRKGGRNQGCGQEYNSNV